MTATIAHDLIIITVVALFFLWQICLHARERCRKGPHPLTTKDIEDICRSLDGKNGDSSWK
ncbi:MAG: hypothetical protein ACE14L_18045 [Terriglobales bacterium]